MIWSSTFRLDKDNRSHWHTCTCGQNGAEIDEEERNITINTQERLQTGQKVLRQLLKWIVLSFLLSIYFFPPSPTVSPRFLVHSQANKRGHVNIHTHTHTHNHTHSHTHTRTHSHTTLHIPLLTFDHTHTPRGLGVKGHDGMCQHFGRTHFKEDKNIHTRQCFFSQK